ncbi:MAG: IS4 family transposase [Candidatus Electryonea clarkiae]|nr:IS4 family transposase [Candidatus Electryonea clarkiae]MDP8286360.1 IS4 family transposase [Candidatus Electryonea clarkiae]
MNKGRTVFSQLMDIIPYYHFQKCVDLYNGNKGVRSFTCYSQFLCMAFAQLTSRRSLRDIEVCLGAQRHKLYHIGINGNVARSTIADANNNRDYRIYRDFAYHLIDIARPLYASEDLGLDLDKTVYAFDSSTIDLCLTLFPWATFRKTKSAVKMHTLLDLQGSIPAFIEITAANVHDVNMLDRLAIEPGAFIVIDKAYLDFKRLYTLSQNAVFFVIRAKKNMKFHRVYSHPVDRSSGIICDQTIVLTGIKTSLLYPQHLRRVRYHDQEYDNHLEFLTNNFKIPDLTVANIYKNRWQVELFFKWIKQHLKIKSFYGTSENAVKTQIWIAVTTYVLVAILKKKLGLEQSLYIILQILSISLFEKVDILQLFNNHDYRNRVEKDLNQLELLF